MNTNELIEPYLLGCLLGDGGLAGNLSFASKDADIIEHVNNSLALYGYCLKKRSTDPKRSSEYNISPQINNNIKYLFYYKDKEYLSTELITALQEDGFPITNHDTLFSIMGISTKTKKSNILKYFPELKNKITYKQLKDTQSSLLLALLDKYNLRCRFDNKHIPEEYFKLSFENRLLLFQGLMDTDGCGSGHRLEFCVACETLANDFVKLAESLGYTARITQKQTKYFNKKYNEIRYGHIAYRVMLNNIDLQPFLCKRKLEMYNTKRIKKSKKIKEGVK